METQTENIGRILNRVIKWSRDDITIDTDQRRVTEMLKDLDLENANHAATPITQRLHVSWKGRSETEGAMDARETINVNRVSAKPSTIGTMPVMVTKSADDNDQRDDVNDSTKY